MNMNETIIKEFKRKVWLTRKNRINASERLNRYDLLAKVYINYYSFIVVAFSIWGLILNNSHINTNYAILIASIFIFVLSLFISSMNFKARAEQLKNCYIKLDEQIVQLKLLENKLSQDDDNEDVLNKFLIIQRQYTDILINSENHNPMDHLITLHSSIDEPFSKYQWFKLFFFKKIIFPLGNIIIIISPFIPFLNFIWKGAV